MPVVKHLVQVILQAVADQFGLAAGEGAAVLMVSTDTDEIVRTANRVLIMRGGRVAAELTGDDITTEKIERAQLKVGQEATTPNQLPNESPMNSGDEGS